MSATEQTETKPRMGYLWSFRFRWEDGTEDSGVTSALTIEQALEEAQFSLEPFPASEDAMRAEVISLVRGEPCGLD